MTHTEAIAHYLRARRGEWVDGRDLARIGGAYAWRSRISDARRHFGLVIENRVRHVQGPTGDRWRISEYRLA